MQRLFSTFAGGWPGAGLLLLRLLAGASLIDFGIGGVREGPPPLTVGLQIIGIAAAILLLVGAFTPVAGVLAAAAKAWIAISQFSSHSGDPCSGDPCSGDPCAGGAWAALALAILAAALAMIGPGAWSIDARRFGRKHIDLSEG